MNTPNVQTHAALQAKRKKYIENVGMDDPCAFLLTLDQNDINDAKTPLYQLCELMWESIDVADRHEVLKYGRIEPSALATCNVFAAMAGKSLSISGLEPEGIAVSIKSSWSHLTAEQKATFLKGMTRLKDASSALPRTTRAS